VPNPAESINPLLQYLAKTGAIKPVIAMQGQGVFVVNIGNYSMFVKADFVPKY